MFMCILAISGTSTTFAPGLPIDSQKIALVFLSISFQDLEYHHDLQTLRQPQI